VHRLAACAIPLALAACGTPVEERAESPPVLAIAVPESPAPVTGSPPPAVAFEPRPEDVLVPRRPIERPQALAPFFDALTELDSGADRKVRVVHWGDSSIGLDQLPAAVRKPLQARFGDGGAGFLLLSRYSPAYRPSAVRLDAGLAWDHCYIAYQCRADGQYGLGGVTFTSTSASTTFRARPHLPGTVAELWYATAPGGGKVAVDVDGRRAALVDTRADTQRDAWETVAVAPGSRAVTVRATGSGKVRLYGLVLEHEGPGVVWDGMTMIGAFTRRLLAWDEAHLRGQVARRDPDLLVFTYGGNDLRRFSAGTSDRAGHTRELSDVIALARAGKPAAACLVLGVHDHDRSGKYTLTDAHVEAAVAAQRDAAFAQGCAFFDQYAAMGGADSFSTWLDESPPLAEPDRKHLNHRGRARMGRWLFEAIVAAWVDHRRADVPTPAG
jgi:lysophospholipase L1-like esterase